VTNALAQYPPFPQHLHSSLSPALSTPPISLSGSSYASTSSFASTQHEASQSSTGSYGAARINVATSPTSRPNNLAASPGSFTSYGSAHSNKPDHAHPSLAAMMASTHLAVAAPNTTSHTTNSGNHPQQLVDFISALFPYQATRALSLAHLLEIVIPHAPLITGAMIDLPPTPVPTRGNRPKFEAGRTVYLHLPPLHPASHAEHAQLGDQGTHHNVDIRDHLTSLLDLVSESLEASELVLVLKRNEWHDEELRDLLHALAYIGGGVLRRVKGDFGGFDERSWVLVGIEV
jgi:hypothetical protein